MIIDCLSKAIMLFILYNIIAILSFGIPESLTKTFYKYKERHDGLKFMYYTFIILMCILLTPCWLKLSNSIILQDFAVVNILTLLFAGASPIVFKCDIDDIDSKPIANLCIKLAAYCYSMFFILWIVLATPFWWIILITLILVGSIAIITKTLYTCYTFWIEITAFISTFIAILLEYLM